MNAGFVVSGRPIVAQTISIGGVGIGDGLDVLRQKKKMFRISASRARQYSLIQEIEIWRA
jgi:hypothetical protein